MLFRPTWVGSPLDEQMIQAGLPVALAIWLYEENVLSLGKAARLAQLPPEAFLEKLGAAGIPVVR